MGDLSRLDTYSGTAVGIESAASTIVAFVAPAGSRAYSPTTSLIEWAGSQDAVKRGLGLDSGAFALVTNPDLTRYDGVAALVAADPAAGEGARLAAANLRAMAVVAAFERVEARHIRTYLVTPPPYRPVGEFIAARNGTFLFTSDEMTRLLRAAIAPSAPPYRDDVLAAAAHLVNSYAMAIGAQVSSREQAARFLLGIRGCLVHQLDALMTANTAAAANAALAVTVPQILAATERFAEVLPFPSDRLFFPGPDFIALAPGAQATVRGTGFPSTSADTYSLINNDLYAGPTGDQNAVGFLASPNTRVVSASVSAANTGQVRATLGPNDTVIVDALPGFSGVTYFDYVAQHPNGEQATGRVYVMVGN